MTTKSHTGAGTAAAAVGQARVDNRRPVDRGVGDLVVRVTVVAGALVGQAGIPGRLLVVVLNVPAGIGWQRVTLVTC